MGVEVMTLWAFGESPSNKERLDSEKAEIGRRELNEIDPDLPDDEKLSKLSDVIVLAADFQRFQNRYDVSEYTELLQDAQKMMIAIPGHAKFHEKQIKDRQRIYNQTGRKNIGGYSETQFRSFSVLEQLPSPEAIQVLGEFLMDDEGGFEGLPEYPEQPGWAQVENSHKATNALFKLIGNSPVPYDEVTLWDIDIPAWRLWYNQVKAGTRTIRFKGDPQEYDLTGPVREARNPNAPRVTKRPGISEVVAANPDRSKTSASPWTVGILILMAGIGMFVHLKKKRQPEA